jgi:hypothetical protein
MKVIKFPPLTKNFDDNIAAEWLYRNGQELIDHEDI